MKEEEDREGSDEEPDPPREPPAHTPYLDRRGSESEAWATTSDSSSDGLPSLPSPYWGE